MSNEEKILAMLAAMQTDMREMHADIRRIDQRLDSVEQRLDSVEEKLDDLIEAHEETRSSVNMLISWVERASEVLTLPLPRL